MKAELTRPLLQRATGVVAAPTTRSGHGIQSRGDRSALALAADWGIVPGRSGEGNLLHGAAPGLRAVAATGGVRETVLVVGWPASPLPLLP
jgi:hypothetical protein